MKWSYWIELYIRTHCVARGLRPLTLAAYEDALKQFHEWVRVTRADIAPDQITARDVLAYLQHLRDVRGNGEFLNFGTPRVISVPVLTLRALRREFVELVGRRDCTMSEPRNRTKYAYDQLHHLTTVTVKSGPYASVTPIKNFVYGPASGSITVDSTTMANAKTRLAEAYTCASPCSTKITDEGFSYTARGEIAIVYESTPHSGGWYSSGATYWANGALETLNDSAGYSLTFGVDGEGRAYSSTDGSGGHPLASTLYNSASLPTQLSFGYTGDSDYYAYDQNTNRMTQYKFTVNGSSLTGSLTWNANGTLGSLLITDPFNSSDTQSCTYTHDDLSRIASANCGSAASQTFSYDGFGNIEKSGSPYSFQADYSSTTNRMTSIGGQTPTYDTNGNVTNDFLNQYTWDANGRPITATNSSSSVAVTYDALGRMVEQNRSGAYTEILYAPMGFELSLMNGQSYTKEFAPMPGGGASVWTPSLFYYRHVDWLGSSRFASTKSRTMYYDGAYAPFGESYAESGTTDRNFTGMNQDTISTAYDFPAREYGIQGRWPSPDPAGMAAANPADPQSWNRYAYVRNSPLMMTDPTGLDGMDGPTICDIGGCDAFCDNDNCITLNPDPANCNPYNLGGCLAPSVNTTIYVYANDGCDPSGDLLCEIDISQALSPGLVTPTSNPFGGSGGGGNSCTGPNPPTPCAPAGSGSAPPAVNGKQPLPDCNKEALSAAGPMHPSAVSALTTLISGVIGAVFKGPGGAAIGAGVSQLAQVAVKSQLYNGVFQSCMESSGQMPAWAPPIGIYQ